MSLTIDDAIEAQFLPLKSLKISERKSWDNSWEVSGVKARLRLALSSSKKWEGTEVEEERLESRPITSASATNTPNIIPTMANPFALDFPIPSCPSLLWCLMCGAPGGGGGAGPDDQEFPPVLHPHRQSKLKTLKNSTVNISAQSKQTWSYSMFSMFFRSSGTQPVNRLFSTFLPSVELSILSSAHFHVEQVN